MTPTMNDAFNYDTAFSRNLGWFTDDEQAVIRNSKVAICGAGGVGAYHAINHARIGFGRFALADFDKYSVENFNRQACAKMSTIDKPKVDVLAEELLDINPEIQIECFPEGVHPDNVDAFLADCDLYLDGLDFFAMDARRLLFSACESKGIPALTAAPLGFGTSFLCFDRHSMSFEDYFGFEGKTELEQLARFYLGLSPNARHSAYLIEPHRLNLATKKGPSLNPGCMQAAATLSANTVKLVLKRGDVIRAPSSIQFDSWLNESTVTTLVDGIHGEELEQRIAAIVALFTG